MIFTETKLKGAFVIEIDKIIDERGFFGRAWCEREMKQFGLNTNIKQTNVSFNTKKGTLRGMHYQVSPFQETKLVSCSRGGIYDVIIDLRMDSPTYKQWIGLELNQNNYKMLYIPEGFAHGFITLEDNTEIHYLMTEFYNPEAGRITRWDDTAFNIKWPIKPLLMSEKDRNAPDYKYLNQD